MNLQESVIMADNDVVYKVSAETAKAFDAFIRLAEAQKRSEKALDDSNRKAKEGKQIFDELGYSLDGVSKAAPKMISALVGMGAVVSIVDTYIEKLKEQKRITA